MLGEVEGHRELHVEGAVGGEVRSPGVPRYAVRTARPGLVRVWCTYRGPAAALCRRYVRYAGGWYVQPVRTVRRLRDVQVSTVAHDEG